MVSEQKKFTMFTRIQNRQFTRQYIITLALIYITSVALSQAIKRDEYGGQQQQQQQPPVYSSSISISSSPSSSSSSSSSLSSSSLSSPSSSSSSSQSANPSSSSSMNNNNNQNPASIYSQQQSGPSSSYSSSPSGASSSSSSSSGSSSPSSSSSQYSSYSSRDASSSPSMTNYGQTYSDHAASASSQSNSYQQAAASVNQALASSGLLNSLSPSSSSGSPTSSSSSASASSSGGQNGPNPSSSPSSSSSSSNLAYYYYYPGSKEASQVLPSQQQQQPKQHHSEQSNGYQATNQYQNILTFPSSSSSGGASSIDSASLNSMGMGMGSHGLNGGGLDTAASNQDPSYMPQPDQYSQVSSQVQANQNQIQGINMQGGQQQNQQQNQYQPMVQQPSQQQYNSMNSYSDYVPPSSQQSGPSNMISQQHNNPMHLMPSASGPSPQASAPNAYADLSSYPSTLSQLSAPQGGQQMSVSSQQVPHGYPSNTGSSSMNPFGGSNNGNGLINNNNNPSQSLGLNSNSIFSSSDLSNAYSQAFNMPNGQANDQTTTFASLAGNSNPYASFAGLTGVGGSSGGNNGQAFNPAQFQSNQFSSGLSGQNPFGAGPFGHQSAQASTNQYSSVAPNGQQDQSTSMSSTNSRRHGIASYIMPLLAVAGLSLLIPTMSNFGIAVGRKKRSIGESNNLIKDSDQDAKETLISEYSDKIKRYYSIYRSAVENDDCMNRLICELGDAVKEVRGKAAVVTVIEKLVPAWMTGKVHVFKDAALASEKGKCHKQFSCKVQL